MKCGQPEQNLGAWDAAERSPSGRRYSLGRNEGPHFTAPRHATPEEYAIINEYADGDMTLAECEARLAKLPDPLGFRSIR